MKWVFIVIGAFLLWKLCRWLSWAIPKIKRLNQLEKFEKKKDVNVFNSKMVAEVKSILAKISDKQELKQEVIYAGSVIHSYWDDDFYTCSVKELNCVIFYSILKELAQRKLMQLDSKPNQAVL